MTAIIPHLSPALQTKLAQYALLAHRAAVLATLPAAAGAKGRPTPWASQPPPKQQQAVLFYAAHPGTPKVGRVVLRAWFQKKAELRAAVYRALEEQGYPLPPAQSDECQPWNIRLSPEDTREEDARIYFQPAGRPVPDAAGASPEEITLMAHLWGWSVLPAQVGATPPGDDMLALAAECYQHAGQLRAALTILAPQMPPALAEAMQRGDVPPAIPAHLDRSNWPVLSQGMTGLYTTLTNYLDLPPLAADCPPNVNDFVAMVKQLEDGAVNSYLYHQHRLDALAVLQRVEGLGHRSQPDFAPLAALKQRTAEVRATYAAEWPLDEAGICRVPLTMDHVQGLLEQANVYRLLLRLVDHPHELETLDETSEDFQKLEAATPSGVLNALLLGKLTVAA